MAYNPSHDTVTDERQLAAFIARHPLAHLFTTQDGVPQADLIPLLLVKDAEAPVGRTLIGHVARNNPVWEQAADSQALVTFGPVEHYISPTWYPSKAAHHRVVPTWNYLVVHAWGPLEVHDDEKFLRGAVARLTQCMEAGRERPWRMAQAPTDYLDEMVKNIVGIRIPLTKLEGRFKVSAQKDAADRLGARDGVSRETTRAGVCTELADAMTSPPQWEGTSAGA